jgi:glycosyltransferase involved in cell wall biosynthesis
VNDRWDILTGEYPPEPGGVADYTQLVAEGLADRGCEVHVWTSAPPGTQGSRGQPDGRITITRLTDPWSYPGLVDLGMRLGRRRRLLVQYTPNAWGQRGLNVGFCRWLAARGRAGDQIRVMFHELTYYIQPGDRPTRWILPAVHRLMVRTILLACTQIDYATEEWGRQLRTIASARQRPMTWLPVPSNIPVVDDPIGVAALRRRLAPRGQTIVGNFGTYGDDLRGRLLPVFPRVVFAKPDRISLLIGRNGERFAAEVLARHPEGAGRLVVAGDLGGEDVSRYLQACDILVQPYPDGVCGRRGTAMACLAHGLAFATNIGPFTEPVLAESGCAAFAPADDAEALVLAAETLLADPGACTRLGQSARALYDRYFALECTLDALTVPVP